VLGNGRSFQDPSADFIGIGGGITLTYCRAPSGDRLIREDAIEQHLVEICLGAGRLNPLNIAVGLRVGVAMARIWIWEKDLIGFALKGGVCKMRIQEREEGKGMTESGRVRKEDEAVVEEWGSCASGSGTYNGYPPLPRILGFLGNRAAPHHTDAPNSPRARLMGH
jgi:hypothetical protein